MPLWFRIGKSHDVSVQIVAAEIGEISVEQICNDISIGRPNRRGRFGNGSALSYEFLPIPFVFLHILGLAILQRHWRCLGGEQKPGSWPHAGRFPAAGVISCSATVPCLPQCPHPLSAQGFFCPRLSLGHHRWSAAGVVLCSATLPWRG